MDRQSQLSRWITVAKARGNAPLLLTLLDAFRPIAPALASGLLVAQPLVAGWNHAGALRELADLLEAPEGVDSLRRQLADEAPE